MARSAFGYQPVARERTIGRLPVARSAFAYQAVSPRDLQAYGPHAWTMEQPARGIAPRDYRPWRVPVSRLPIDSPTLLTRRRYGEGSLTGYLLDLYSIGQAPTTVIKPPAWGTGFVSPAFRHRAGSDVGTFLGGLCGAPDGRGGVTFLESDPNRLKATFASARNVLVNIAHRSINRPMEPAIDPRLWVQRTPTQRARSYSLPYQLETPTAQQLWPTALQWMAGLQARGQAGPPLTGSWPEGAQVTGRQG
ncbi:MAG: hypothetical protein J2P28_12040 [Actinobacteria bacterium]|nr:hypothetical protein [Actinomycetota bacterium]